MKKKPQEQTIDHTQTQELCQTTVACPKCFTQGQQHTILHKIQNFKDITLAKFSCSQCGEISEEMNFVQKKNDFGVEILFVMQHLQDAERQVVLSQTANITIQDSSASVEIKTTARLTTIRGVIQFAVNQVQHQKNSYTEDSSTQQQKAKTLHLINVAEKTLNGTHFPLTIKIRDPSGNSNVKNLNYPLPDKNIQLCYFQRTVQQLQQIGYTLQQAQLQVSTIQEKKKGIKLNFNKPFQQKDFMHKQAIVFQVPCHTCLLPGEMKLCQTSVPYFTDLVIMSFSCEYCGAHSVQTKNSGEIHDEALEIILKVDTEEDLKRDLFKSDTCKVCVPELELELDYGTLGGQYTTVEGLLQKVHEHLSGRNQFVDVDSEFSSKMKEFLKELWKMKEGERPFTLELIDPLSRSFLQNPFHPLEDKKAKIVSRKRNQQEEDVLGLAEMNVEHYQ